MAFGSDNCRGGRGKSDISSKFVVSQEVACKGEREREGQTERGVGHINCENNCKCHGYVYMRCKLQRKLKLSNACCNFFSGREGAPCRCN